MSSEWKDKDLKTARKPQQEKCEQISVLLLHKASRRHSLGWQHYPAYATWENFQTHIQSWPMPTRQHDPPLQMKDWKILSKYLTTLFSPESYINMLHIMKCSLSSISPPPQIFLAHGSVVTAPSPASKTPDLPASRNHRRSDNPRVQSWSVTGTGKNVWGNSPVKTNEQRITEHTQLNPRKILNSIHLHSQSALEHSPGKIHTTAACLELLNIKTFCCFKFFKIKLFFSCKISTPTIPMTFPTTWEWNCIQALHSLGSFQYKTQQTLWYVISSSKNPKIGVTYQGFEKN